MNLQTRIEADLNHGAQRFDQPASIVMTTLAALGKRWWLILAVTILGTAVALLVLSTMPSLYTSEAILELSFEREVPATAAPSRQIASMDPGALVNGAAVDISSRANASKVVDRLKLESDYAVKPRSYMTAIMEQIRKLVGFSRSPLPPHELAVNKVLQDMTVTYKAHVYVIGIAYTDKDPETAARIANALVSEYLRGERLKELGEKRGTEVRELATLSESVGVLHPKYQQAQSRIQRLDEEMSNVDKDEADPKTFVLAGQYVTSAVPILTPTSPRRVPILLLGLSGSLALGVLAGLLAALLSERRKLAEQA